jgi:hypothetical protein
MTKSKSCIGIVTLGLLICYCILRIIIDFTVRIYADPNSMILPTSTHDIVVSNKHHRPDDDVRVSNLIGNNSSTQNRSSTSTSGTKVHRPQQRNISLIVQLRGELGNHLSILANAKITQLIIQEQFPHLHIRLIGQHQNHKKWKRAYNDIKLCFPSLYKEFQFDGGIYDLEFIYIQSLQNSWLNQTEQKKLINVRYDGLVYIQKIINQQEEERARGSDSFYSNKNHMYIPQQPMNCTKYSLPYLIADSNSFSWNDGLKNTTYYKTIRNWLQINTSNTQCCSQMNIPYPNEIVYHHRNFMYEMKQQQQKRTTIQNHYTEANPYTLSNLIFRNLTTTNTNHPIAITSRYRNGIQPHIDALQNKNRHHNNHTTIQIRFIENQTGIQDFCFLLQTQFILIGKYQSTYTQWASFLGTATINRFYALNLYYNHNNDGENTNHLNLTSPVHPFHMLETIQQSNRTFISEQYWQLP